MTMTVLITGANRGIGLELTRQYLAENHKVFACCRSPHSAEALQSLHTDYPNSLSIHQLEVTSTQDIEQLATALNNIPVDRLINNAGIYGDKVPISTN